MTATVSRQPGSSAAQRRADALRRAAQSKHQAATARADAAIRQLIKEKRDINFRSVARAAGVSLDFLYASTELRQRIEKLRAQQATRTASHGRRRCKDPGQRVTEQAAGDQPLAGADDRARDQPSDQR